MADFAGILATAKRPRASVSLCLRGDLFAEHARLRAELGEIARNPDTDSLAGDPRLGTVRARLAGVEEQMTAATMEFTFEALPRAEYAALADAHPPGPSGEIPPGFFQALVAAALVDPALTAGEVDQLYGVLSKGQAQALEGPAWAVNESDSQVPF